MHLNTAAPTEFLSVEEQAALIGDAQDVPVEIVVDEDGTERAVYGRTAASEAALDRLTRAFLPAIHKAARASKAQTFEEAESVVLEAFVNAVRRFDLTSSVPFSATISTILFRAVSDSDRTSDLIVVSEAVAARYWRLIHKHDGDVAAAYEEAQRETSHHLGGATFLAVHNIIGGLGSIDPLIAADDEGSARFYLAATEGHEAQIVDRDRIRRLFDVVSEQEGTIVRLAYGFSDSATETLRVAHGFSDGECLSDLAISEVVGLGRATTNRRRLGALAAMKADLLNDEE